MFVHPFDDVDIVRGQAGVGLELLDDVPNLAHVVVPIGGGGLASGVAMAIKLARPDVRITGVQAAACAPYLASLREHQPIPVPIAPTIADGIAIKRPGELTLGLIERYLDDLVTVEDDDIAEAMVLLLERGKLLAEGAGAASTAALLTGAVHPPHPRRDGRDRGRRQPRRQPSRPSDHPPREPRRTQAAPAHPRARPPRRPRRTAANRRRSRRECDRAFSRP